MPSETRSSTARHFRPDIQGLRALAVGTVILAHAGFGTVSGGFVGVDVFFVISGFLITSLLMREADRTGRISLLGFYARRARRILPAAALVAMATVVASILFLPLVRAVEIIKDSIWAAAFGANIRFAVVGTDYFAKGEPASPLQHYWSLSVEEQFYLVWPLLLVGAIALAATRGRRLADGWGRRTPLLMIGVLSVLSFAWSVHATYQSPTTAYFSTLTRAWELGVGAGLGVLMSRGQVRAPRWLVQALGLVGLGAVLLACFWYTPETRFPGYQALLPVLGTAALLYAGGATDQGAVSRLMSLTPARVVGDWSYSLYLWHWPVLRIAEDHLHHRRLPLDTLFLCLVLIVGLSALTYRYVETPFRTGRLWARPRIGVALYPLSLALVLVMAVSGRAWIDRELGVSGDNPAITTADFHGKRLSKDPAVALVQASAQAAEAGTPIPSDLTPPLLGLRKDTAPLGDCDYRTGTRGLCANGDTDADKTIVLVGDSHARAWSPAFTALGQQQGYTTYYLVFSGCSATRAVQAEPQNLRPWSDCEDFKDWVVQTVGRLHPDLTVVATSAVSPIVGPDGDPVGVLDQRDEFRSLVTDGFAQELAELKPFTDRLVVLGNTPKLPREPGVCMSQGGDVTLEDCLFRRGPVAHAIQMDFKQAAASQDVEFVNALPWFCFELMCPPVIGSTIAMRDSEHMTPEYAVELAEPLARKLRLTS
ncbi:acyltransferase [Nocardioides islandensis]|uniref:Acyltransferase n=1 Tax=Nocardioides islandensis TaxID=433663 RepID=A0A930YHE1_9ACTN|nr:acyltransferase family protein [Nocardioides islandensis]MBF4762899.1 acyltransferase [Nocardioides islandensis]